MSVTMHLYHYYGTPYFTYDENGEIDWFRYVPDNAKFDTIDYYPKYWRSTKIGRKMYKNLSNYHNQFVYTKCSRHNHGELPVYEFLYAQGWFFKNKFFKREFPCFYCTTKEGMINFFKRYIKLPKNEKDRENIIKTLKQFVDGFGYDTIFAVRW